MIGFCRVGVNFNANASFAKVDHNTFYGSGGMFNTNPSNLWYFGGDIQTTTNVSNVEICYNETLQTLDSPISPQMIGGTVGCTMSDIWIHHNTITYWAVAAVEISDFGTDNKFINFRIEDNVMLKAGQGFNATGDSPQGFTDVVAFRNAPGTRGLYSNITVSNNRMQGVNTGVSIIGAQGVFSSPLILNDNIISGSTFGVNNGRTANCSVLGNRNTFCGNQTAIKDTAAASLYQNSTINAGVCL